MRCIAFFQKIDPNSGALVHDFTDKEWDTRFLGDLYQDLSEAARKKYALLQTPVFVEEFILDRTLDPAIEEFGLAKPGYENRLLPDGRLTPDDRFKMIDPACGSGHFLLGSFSRLVDRWRRKEPGTKTTVLVQRALDGVHGVDLNPYAVAIARFRLLLAALKECGITRLSHAPGLEIQLACGDSLLHGGLEKDPADVRRDRRAEARLPAGRSRIPGKDPPVWRIPRRRREPAVHHAKRSSVKPSVPGSIHDLPHEVFAGGAVPRTDFLARVQNGFTGQITSNSFMKREFGKKLIESFFHTVDLTHVIDTKGAYIPGHATPTVILFGRHRPPFAGTLRTVMGIRGEPATPERSGAGPGVVGHRDAGGSAWLAERICQRRRLATRALSESPLVHRRRRSSGIEGATGGGSAGDPLSLATAEIGVLGMTNVDDV